MLPLHASGVAACTYHFFYNNPDLAFLVTLQAGLTALGNTTVAIAAFRLALSNGWTIGELDPRKLVSKGDDGEASPATAAEAEAAAPAAAAYGGAAIVPSAAKLVLLTVLASSCAPRPKAQSASPAAAAPVLLPSLNAPSSRIITLLL